MNRNLQISIILTNTFILLSIDISVCVFLNERIENLFVLQYLIATLIYFSVRLTGFHLYENIGTRTNAPPTLVEYIGQTTNDECPMCLEKLQNDVIICKTCNNGFCFTKCVQKFIINKDICPICRNNLFL